MESCLASSGKMSQRLYCPSYLIVYYFMEVEGKRDGTNFIRYVRAAEV